MADGSFRESCNFIALKVFIKSFCKSLLPHKSFSLSLVITHINSGDPGALERKVVGLVHENKRADHNLEPVNCGARSRLLRTMQREGPCLST